MDAQGTAHQPLITMQLERLSLRILITGMLMLVVLLSVAHTLIAKRQFRDAAVDFRVQSLTRIVEVGSEEVLRQARLTAISLGTSLQERLPPQMNDPELQARLDEPLIKGFVGANDIDLVSLRVYDSNYRYIAGSTAGLGLPPALPPLLADAARQRQGVERLKALGSLWPSPHGALYSILVPIGGLKLRGYIEVVFNPLHNLRNVATMINMPFGVQASDTTWRLQPAGIRVNDPAFVPVAYNLHYSDGSLALSLVCFEKVDNIYGAIHRDQLLITLGFFASLLGLLALVFWLLHRYLFLPVHHMIRGMENSLHNKQVTPIDNHAIKEIHIAANAFNSMARKVADYIATLQRMSIQDGLTGIANRRHFDLVLAEEWQRAARHGGTLSLILIDVDFFKQYNDHYGHQAGDQCLRDVATCLSNSVQRAGDLVARYGGEEFVVLLPDCDAAGASVVAQGLQQGIEQLDRPHAVSSVASHVTLSLGMCTFSPKPSDNSSLLLGRADAALYRAKNNGRNRIERALPDEIDQTAPGAL